MASKARIVFDTSVVVSAVLLPRSVPCQAFDLAVATGTLLVSLETIGELDEVTPQQFLAAAQTNGE
jgi:predicted nucleic acid-binding protein